MSMLCDSTETPRACAIRSGCGERKSNFIFAASPSSTFGMLAAAAFFICASFHSPAASATDTAKYIYSFSPLSAPLVFASADATTFGGDSSGHISADPIAMGASIVAEVGGVQLQDNQGKVDAPDEGILSPVGANKRRVNLGADVTESSNEPTNGPIVPTVDCDAVAQFTLVTGETRITQCDFAPVHDEMGFLLAGAAPSLVLTLSTFGGYFVNISTPGPLSSSVPVVAKILIMNNLFTELFSSLNFQVNLAPTSSITVMLNSFRWLDQNRFASPSDVYALPGSSYAAIMFSPTSFMDGTNIVLQSNGLTWLQAHGNESSFSFIHLDPASMANSCVVVINCAVDLINEAALRNATWLNQTEITPVLVPATNVTTLGAYALPSYAPSRLAAPPTEMILYRLAVDEGSQLLIYANTASQNSFSFDTVAFRVSLADGPLFVAASTFLDVVVLPEAQRDVVPFSVTNNTFGVVGEGDLLIEEEPAQPGQVLFVRSVGLSPSSDAYTMCGNAIVGSNFTASVDSLTSLLHYSDWGGSFVPDSLRCGREPTNPALAQCMAPLRPIALRARLFEGQQGAP